MTSEEKQESLEESLKREGFRLIGTAVLQLTYFAGCGEKNSHVEPAPILHNLTEIKIIMHSDIPGDIYSSFSFQYLSPHNLKKFPAEVRLLPFNNNSKDMYGIYVRE